VLRGLVEIYEAVARRQGVPYPLALAREIDRIRDWDRLVVAPRHGYLGAEDYYARVSVAPLLGRLRVPARLLLSTRDPMVPTWTLERALAAAEAPLEVSTRDTGGHVSFPGAGAEERGLLAWMLDAPRSRRAG
jgi:predicted alpha/beta-fold hydrolase